MIAKIVIAMAVGSVIGYITNDLAIRMLFRPKYPLFLGKWKLPFTPGLIPKEKKRLAISISQTISQNLLSSEVLSKNLNSSEMKIKVEVWFDDLVLKQLQNKESVKGLIYNTFGRQYCDKNISNLKGQVTDLIVISLQRKDVSEQIADALLDGVKKRMKNNFLGDIFGGVIDGVGEIFSQATRNVLIKNINTLFKENSAELVSNLIDREGDNLLNMKIKDIVAENSHLVPKLKESLINTYSTIIEKDLPRILRTVDISKIVENRINEFDPTMLEELILGVARKELKAIVWLGAFLGAIMGIANVVIGLII